MYSSIFVSFVFRSFHLLIFFQFNFIIRYFLGFYLFIFQLYTFLSFITCMTELQAYNEAVTRRCYYCFCFPNVSGIQWTNVNSVEVHSCVFSASYFSNVLRGFTLLLVHFLSDSYCCVVDLIRIK